MHYKMETEKIYIYFHLRIFEDVNQLSIISSFEGSSSLSFIQLFFYADHRQKSHDLMDLNCSVTTWNVPSLFYETICQIIDAIIKRFYNSNNMRLMFYYTDHCKNFMIQF